MLFSDRPLRWCRDDQLSRIYTWAATCGMGGRNHGLDVREVRAGVQDCERVPGSPAGASRDQDGLTGRRDVSYVKLQDT